MELWRFVKHLRKEIRGRQRRHIQGANKTYSELDILMLGCMFPKYTSVTAKKSLKYIPFLGWFSKSNSFKAPPNHLANLTSSDSLQDCLH